MQSLKTFELHSFSVLGHEDGAKSPLDLQSLPWQEKDRPPPHVLVLEPDVGAEGKPYRVGLGRGHDRLIGTSDEHHVIAEFYIVHRRLGSSLAMIPRHNGVLINGLPALPFQVLSPRDGLLLAPRLHTYVTERIRPYVGKPTAEMLGKRCPFCRIPIDKDTWVITCRCGVAYHAETAETHPDAKVEDRLVCFQKIRACLSCHRPLTTQSTLVWDPATL